MFEATKREWEPFYEGGNLYSLSADDFPEHQEEEIMRLPLNALIKVNGEECVLWGKHGCMTGRDNLFQGMAIYKKKYWDENNLSKEYGKIKHGKESNNR